MVRACATPLTVVAIADELGDVHINTVRFHLDALVDAGRIERVVGEISGPGRPADCVPPQPVDGPKRAIELSATRSDAHQPPGRDCA